MESNADKKRKRLPYMQRLVPKISTSCKVFIDKKTKAKHRRNLNKLTEQQ